MFKVSQQSSELLESMSAEERKIAEYITEGLNEQQKMAVLTTEGYVRLVAGAGAGKTNALTKRLAYLVGKGVKAEEILSLTFTNKAAEEMRVRAAKLLGVDKESLSVATFHSYCNAFLMRNIKLLGWGTFNICTDLILEEILQTVMENNNLLVDFEDYVEESKKKNKNVAYAFSKSKFLVKLKSRLQSYRGEAEYMEYLFGEKEIECKLPSFRDIEAYINYENIKRYTGATPKYAYKGVNDPLKPWVQAVVKELGKEHLLSFDDLILLTSYIFKEYPEILAQEQEKYKYVQIDEFQDTDKEQLYIVKSIASRSGNLFVVGDADQSIYGFRGAKPTLFINLDKELPNLKSIYMTNNYRSVPEIIEVSNKVITLCQNRLDKELKATRGTEANKGVRVVQNQNLQELSRQVVFDIQDKVARGICNYKDIAILYRTGKSPMIQELQNLMKYHTVPFGSTNLVVDNKMLLFFVYIMRAIADTYDVQTYKSLIHLVRGSITGNQLKSISLKLTKRTDREKNRSSLSVLKEMIANQEIPLQIEIVLNYIEEQTEVLRNQTELDYKFFQTYMEWYSNIYLTLGVDESSINLKKQVYQIVHSATLLIKNMKGMDKVTMLTAIMNEIMTRQDDILTAEEKDAVKFLTVHKSKGMEFKVVYCIDMVEGMFPAYKAEDLDEECRIVYVAYTRAKDYLYLLTGGYDAKTKKPKTISPYVDCLKAKVLKTV